MSDSLPKYSVSDLNKAIKNLLERGFAPRFLLQATIAKSQLKKGHLWLTLTDAKSSITGVIWSSQLKKINYNPTENDIALIVGKLNFWEARATLIVHILDIKPTMETVLRQFEIVKDLLLKEGVIDPNKIRPLPKYPKVIGLLTSVPSSALADMLKTANERWPNAKVFVIPIPVQGDVSGDIQVILNKLYKRIKFLEIQVLVLARGGGSREDLIVFDNPDLCRDLARSPVPLITGIGHEDDFTVSDLIADYRTATPTAAIVRLLPSIEIATDECQTRLDRLRDYFSFFIRRENMQLEERLKLLDIQEPIAKIINARNKLSEKSNLLDAFSPERWLSRGFSIVSDSLGSVVKRVEDISIDDKITIKLSDGQITSIVTNIDSADSLNDKI